MKTRPHLRPKAKREKPPKKRLFLAVDPLFASLLLRAVGARLRRRFEIVGAASDRPAALALCRKLQPQVVVIDTGMAGVHTLALLRELLALPRRPRVLALVDEKRPERLPEVLRTKVRGVLGKEHESTRFLQVLETVAEGARYVDPIVVKLIEEERSEKLPAHPLTDREREILCLVASSRTNKEAATDLFLSPKTVEKHRGSLMKKLHCRDTAALTRYAMRAGLLGREAGRRA